MRTNIARIILLSGVLCGFVSLTACNKYVDKTNKKIETIYEQAETYRDVARIPDLPEPVDTVRIQNDIWLGTSSSKITEGDPLPAALEKDDGVTISLAGEVTLPILAQEIMDVTHIVVRLDDLKSENEIPENTLPVNYSGKLSGLLNYIANRYGVWWKYQGGIITFFTKETRVFTIYALPTETSLSATLTGASMGENSGGGSASSSLNTSANLSLWDNIEEGIKQIVGENDKVSFSRVAGTVTVTASPFVIRKVGQYVANWNEKLSRQVAISVKVLQVSLTNEDSYGLDLRLAFNSNKLGSSFSSPYFIDAAGGGATGSVGLLSMALLDPGSRWKDSQSIIQALSTQGKTSLVTSTSVTTLNNKVAPVQISTAQNYVKETNVTTSGSGTDRSTEVDMDTDTLNYGFTMEILPRILDHGRLIVMFSLTLTDLLSLDQFSSNDGLQTSEDSSDEEDTEEETGDRESTIVQLPKMQMRGFIQEIAMRSGSTLVLTGFESANDTTDTAGIGKAKMGILGGKAYSSNTRDVMVILMTPEVLQSPLSPEARMRNF